jgi:hypothetical protein
MRVLAAEANSLTDRATRVVCAEYVACPVRSDATANRIQ